MDTSFLNFHQEETFQAFHSSSYYLDDIYGDLGEPHYGWDSERELPSDGTGGLSDRSTSPQNTELDNMLLLERWTQHISSLEIPTVSDLTEVCGPISTVASENLDPIGHLADDSDFDITKYVNEPDIKTEEGVPSPKEDRDSKDNLLPIRPGGKKIDMKNCRYIFAKEELKSEGEEEEEEEGDVDVETLSESEDSKVGLIKPKGEIEEVKKVVKEEADSFNLNLDDSIIRAGDLVSLLEQFEATENESKEVKVEKSDCLVETKVKKIRKPEKTQTNLKQVKVKGKEIPSKHIKVKEKPKQTKTVGIGKTKQIKIGSQKNVILKPSITNQKTIIGNETLISQRNKIELIEKSNRIIKEVPVINPEDLKVAKKAVRKEQRPSQNLVVIKRLNPTIKHTNTIEILTKLKEPKEKTNVDIIKTINLDHDYCLSKSNINNINNNKSHVSIVDRQRSILRNQPTVKTADGKVMVSLLKVNTIKNPIASPGNSKKKLNLEEYKRRRQNRSLTSNSQKPTNPESFWGLDPYPKLPQNLEMKTYVSIGVNTTQTWAKVREITKQNTLDFSPNSLIASMVERLPTTIGETQTETAENKTIVYLDKNRPKKETSNKKIQTDFVRRRTRVSSSSSCSSRSSSRSVSPENRKRRRTSSERIKEIEERRVIYVGRIADGTTPEDLKKRFYKFGPINYASVHFRRNADNYGFVTFRYKEDAYEAVEHGNDDPKLPRYDLSFGGRRVFCKTSYSDLDDMRGHEEYIAAKGEEAVQTEGGGDTFEELLRDFQVKVRNKKVRSS